MPGHRLVHHIGRLVRHAPLALVLFGWFATFASGGADFPFRFR